MFEERKIFSAYNWSVSVNQFSRMRLSALLIMPYMIDCSERKIMVAKREII